MSAIHAYLRADGTYGVRNHLLVLPSVVCATHAAREIGARVQAVAITHQHGCLHVGDDLLHTERLLEGVAGNPNVGAVVLVSLGCETLRAKALSTRLIQRGKPTMLIGIQSAGGTAAAIERGVHESSRLRHLLSEQCRKPLSTELLVGIDDPVEDALSVELRRTLKASSFRPLLAPGDLEGPEAHLELAARGAQIIISRPPEHEAPMGFATCPVLSIARGGDLHTALAEDFDLPLSQEQQPSVIAASIADRLAAVAAGAATAAEQRGAGDFVLSRLAMTM